MDLDSLPDVTEAQISKILCPSSRKKNKKDETKSVNQTEISIVTIA